MSILIAVLLGTLATVATVLAAIFATEVVAGALSRPPRPDHKPVYAPGSLAVLVPAHDEASTLRPTLERLRAELAPGDRLLVVADNCSDQTAAIARQAGAQVLERIDADRRGKGFALDAGVQHLRADPPGTVIVIDADCAVTPGAIARLASIAQLTGRPVQAEYVMLPPPASEVDHALAVFAWRIKNGLRPRGLTKLGLPCQLLGTGMAFPWDIIARANLATAAIVEDLKLGLELAEAGRAPLFCPSALVTSYFPESIAGAQSQRERWEGGHIHLIKTMAGPALLRAARSGNRDLFVLAFDLAVPPLTLLALALALVTTAAAVATAMGVSAVPLLIATFGVALFAIAVVIAWRTAGRDVLPLWTVTKLAGYLGQKIVLYRRLSRGRQTKEWVRTERGSDKRP